MHRRHLLALVAAAAALPAAARADTQTLALAKAFPLLDTYFRLLPAERSRFYLAYRAMRDKRPTADVHAVLVAPTEPPPCRLRMQVTGSPGFRSSGSSR